MTIAQTREIVAALDTAHISRLSDTTARVRYRFTYTTPMPLPGDTTGVLMAATEADTDLNCARELARSVSLTIEMVDSVRSSALTPEAPWQSFAAHPLGRGLFVTTCRSIGTPVRSNAT